MAVSSISTAYCLLILLYSLYLSSTTPENSALNSANKRTEYDLFSNNRTDTKTGLHLKRMVRQISYAPPTTITGQQIASDPVSRPSLTEKPFDPQEEVTRYERINQGFERMLQFVTIAGQIDSYLSERAKSFINRLSKLTDDDDSRLQSRRSKCR